MTFADTLLYKQQAYLKEKLRAQYIFINFIGEVYPLLYNKINDDLNNFTHKYKDKFQLFAKTIVVQNSAAKEDETKYDDNDDDKTNKIEPPKNMDKMQLELDKKNIV